MALLPGGFFDIQLLTAVNTLITISSLFLPRFILFFLLLGGGIRGSLSLSLLVTTLSFTTASATAPTTLGRSLGRREAGFSLLQTFPYSLQAGLLELVFRGPLRLLSELAWISWRRKVRWHWTPSSSCSPCGYDRTDRYPPRGACGELARVRSRHIWHTQESIHGYWSKPHRGTSGSTLL